MDYRSLIFDRVSVRRVVPDGDAFKVYVENIGEGRAARGAVRVEVSESALGCLSEPVETWVGKTIRWIANSHENDGRKVDALIGRAPILLDSRYVV
jgi:hypothetical protein